MILGLKVYSGTQLLAFGTLIDIFCAKARFKSPALVREMGAESILRGVQVASRYSLDMPSVRNVFLVRSQCGSFSGRKGPVAGGELGFGRVRYVRSWVQYVFWVDGEGP